MCQQLLPPNCLALDDIDIELMEETHNTYSQQDSKSFKVSTGNTMGDDNSAEVEEIFEVEDGPHGDDLLAVLSCE